MPGILLEVRGLRKYFPVTRGILRKTVGQVKAVDGVDFILMEGEVLGIVGESGCGKTTVGRTILRLLEPSAGEIWLHLPEGKMIDLSRASQKTLKRLRPQMQIIYQDPYSSLNGRMRVGDIIGEPLLVNGVGDAHQRQERVRYLLRAVGLNPDHALRYPHEFSGGQLQRIAIARALSLSPRLIVADEPVSALDVSIQAQILELFQELQREFRLSCLLISHDLAVVKYISHRIAVMYLGQIVEMAGTEGLFQNPRHPYTEALISAVPIPDPDYPAHRILLRGDVPSPLNPPSGCRFHPRCRYAKDVCKTDPPIFQRIGDDHFVRCHLAEKLTLQSIPIGR